MALGLPQRLGICLRAEGLPLGLRSCPRAKGLPLGLWHYPRDRGIAPREWETSQVLAPTPKMVWGLELQLVALFGAATRGFCMFFPTTLVLATPDLIFGSPKSRSGPW